MTEALQLTETTLDRFWEAELYRIKGALTLAQSSVQSLASRVQTTQKAKAKMTEAGPRNPDPQAEAEACFLHTIEVARHQGAKSLKLRAVMSLSRLWQHQDKKKPARQLLAEIYGWFTEGFDTADLQEAKALLATLS